MSYPVSYRRDLRAVLPSSLLSVVGLLALSLLFQPTSAFAASKELRVEVQTHPWETPLSGCRAVVDPRSGALFVYGGARNSVRDGKAAFDFDRSVRRNRVSKTLGEWAPLPTEGDAPTPRSYGSLVLHKKGRSAFLFGGFDPAFKGDVWELSLGKKGGWKQLHAGGEGAPSARDAHVACDDGTGRGFLVFGGLGTGGITNDLWHWSYKSKSWSQITTKEGPAPRFTSALCKSDKHTAIVIGGFNGQAKPLGEVWQLDTRKHAWKRLADLPEAVSAPAAVWHPKLERVIVLGGSTAAGAASKAVWSYDPKGDAWTKIGELSEAVAHSTAVYSKKSDSVILIGGTTSHFAAAHPKQLIQEVRIVHEKSSATR